MGTSTLITGAAGTGKSVLCTQYGLAAARRGEREPTQMSPGEFADTVRTVVERDDARLIVIDSINGYMQAMPSERLLTVQVHELLSYLANYRVSILMTLVQHGVFGGPVDEAAEVSYLADTVLLLRYFEHAGAVRQAVSVVKKRSGPHGLIETVLSFARVEAGTVRFDIRKVSTSELVNGSHALVEPQGTGARPSRRVGRLRSAGLDRCRPGEGAPDSAESVVERREVHAACRTDHRGVRESR